MTFSKRIFDLVWALGLMVILAPIISGVFLAVLLIDGRPVFYVSERMKAPEQGFRLIKFRTMQIVKNDSGVSGGDKAARITRTGAFLRRTRLDELPQLWNILSGDMSFVGPRPPLRLYVARCPEIYRTVLQSRPGVTGLASLYFHKHEASLLAPCASSEETDEVYVRRCVPRKARLDLIYQRNRSLLLDVKILARTLGVIFAHR
ncbi:sugar transferase [Celeribacter litoreus]|uniref:sugar transferase n=1 Tax=Celeribacter litoreus TaxID=2876714 RepID=UPI001CD03C04|nr:sugar transferase [Celeribacter litoreus]MCA0042258.1 sugar transferase [Celeribacter litoreus]